MKITMTKLNLLAGLNKLTKIVNNKTIPVLAMVKITAKNGKVELIGSNVDLTGIVTVESENVENEGITLLNYSDLHKFLKKSKSDLVTIENNDNKVTVSAGKVEFKVVSHDCTEYPNMPIMKYDEMTLTNKEFKKAIENTGYSISASETRPVLTAINIKVDQYGLKFVSTDSHRLGMYTLNKETNLNNIEVNPTGNGLNLAYKLLEKKSNSDVVLKFSGQYTALQFDNMELIVKNVEGNYPDTSRLIPDTFYTELELKTDELLELLPQIAVFNEDRNAAIKLNYNENSVNLSNINIEKGKISSNVVMKAGNGENLEICFSQNFFEDVLKVIDSETVKIKFVGKMRPFIVEGIGNGEKHLILPIRTY